MKKGLNYIASPSNQVVESDKAKFLDSKAIAEHAEVPLSSGRWGGSGGVACVWVTAGLTEECQYLCLSRL